MHILNGVGSIAEYVILAAFEWYASEWNGNKCFLILGTIESTKGLTDSVHDRSRDATCYIKPVIGWRNFPNSCASSDGEDMLQTANPVGNAFRKRCQHLCVVRDTCSAFEWYESKLNGNKCFLMLGTIGSTTELIDSVHDRSLDATCYIKPSTGWKMFPNYCVSSDGKNMAQTAYPNGNAHIRRCQHHCAMRDNCSAFEWYESEWNGNKCFLMLGTIKSTKGVIDSVHSKWRDATCSIKPVRKID